MISSLSPTAPLGILQAIHVAKRMSEERVRESTLHGEECRTQPAASMVP